MSTMTNRRNGIPWRAIILLAIIWVLLWGELSLALLLFGAVLGLLVTWVFPLPPLSFHGRLRPLGLVYLAFRLVTDLVVSSIQVVRVVFDFRRQIENAVIRVPLRSHSDLYLTVTAELTCLVPGSVVLEARRSEDTLYVHVMDVRGPEDLEDARQHTLGAEQRVLKAFGSDEEIRCLREGQPIPRPDDPRTGRIVEGGQGAMTDEDDDPFDPMEETFELADEGDGADPGDGADDGEDSDDRANPDSDRGREDA